MTDFVMPKLGADMTAGTLVAWRKKAGDPVRRGDIMAEVDTDKGVIDVESFAEGVIEQLLVAPGATVPVGTPLAAIRAAGEPPSAGPASAALAEPSPPTVAPAPSATSIPRAVPPPSSATAGMLTGADLSRLRISPSARLRARQLGVDPRSIQGTGRGGAITREDIEAAAARAGATGPPPAAALPSPAPAVPATPPRAEPPAADRNARMRQAIAAAMSRANRDIPHYYLSTTIDMHRALEWLAGENEQRPLPERLLYGVLLLKATALALREVPELNAFWLDDGLTLQPSIHLGVAVSLRGGGLIAPAIHDADQKDLATLMRDLQDLVARVRSGGLRSSELSEQTITVTSLGEQGVEAVYGVIYPPQVALVGFGKIVERPWCVEGKVIPRRVITVTLAGDHRATDGHRGGIFLAAVDRLLQEPEKL